MRLLIAGGGTGGHLYPGVAVAEELLGRGSENRVLFAGTERGIEARVLPRLGLPFVRIRAAGLVGMGAAARVKAAAALGLGFGDAAAALLRFRPHACLGVGGYASFPVVALAGLCRIPAAVQEQNARPGLANRVLGRLVRRVYLGDTAASRWFPSVKVVSTGNPLRRSLLVGSPYAPPGPGEPLRLLVLGGSQGARALNEAAPPAVGLLPFAVEVLHQAGRGRAAEVTARYQGVPDARAVEFIEDVAPAYARAHLVIARAGALTVAELAAAGRPAILVPFPFAAGGHQEANARSVEAAGAGLVILEQDLTPEKLAGHVLGLAGEPERLARMAAAAERSARREAARTIVDDLLGLVNRKS